MSGVRRSEMLAFERREAPDEANVAARRLLRAGLVRRQGSGRYATTPVGERVRRAVVDVVEGHLRAAGARAVSLPHVQGRAAWTASGRWRAFEGEMLTLEDRTGRRLCLAPSHEEAVVELVRGVVRSHDDLPACVFQTGRKHRDDHPRRGLYRTKEFTMTDAYSLHADAAGLREWYDRLRTAFREAFRDLGLTVETVAADNSVMGGSRSEEFVAPVPEGTLDLCRCGDGCGYARTDEAAGFDAHADGEPCPDCGATLVTSGGVEVGHVFELGTRYSEPMDLTVDDPGGGTTHVVMGSYGIGIERTLQTVVAQHADADGLRWPVTDAGTVAPYHAAVVPLRYEGRLRELADRLHERVGPDRTLLFDDPDETIGERFAVADLLGVPVKLVLGNRFRETGRVEVETRAGETTTVEPDRVPEVVAERTGTAGATTGQRDTATGSVRHGGR